MNIQQLCDRYNLKNRQSIYNWCNTLGIKLLKDDSNKAYATNDQIEQLDQLSEHLTNGGTLKNFTPLVKIQIDTVNHSLDTVNLSIDKPLETNQNQDLIEMVTAIAGILKPQSILSKHRELEEAARENWILSSRELTALGFKPVCKSGEDYCDRGCWRFSKAGKIGREQGWTVKKLLRE